VTCAFDFMTDDIEAVQLSPRERLKQKQIPWEAITLGNELGRGTETIVYEGTYEKRPVAVKMLNADARRETQYTFRTELEVVLGKLDWHPNILNYYGWGVRPSDGSKFLVMELFEGGPISRRRKWVSRRPQLVYRIMRDVARALAYIHAHDLIHRDLKSSNVLVDRPARVAKLSDFGVSRTQGDSEAVMTALTGTYRFMAPEVIRGERYDGRADIYSYGILFNELLTGIMPYEDTYLTPVQTATAVVSKNLRPRLVKTSDKVPASVVALIERCWDLDPEKRPSAEEIASFLDVLCGEAAAASPDGSLSDPDAAKSSTSFEKNPPVHPNRCRTQ
jgi:serine/threonine protein kinase